jgi:hypothetical protein
MKLKLVGYKSRFVALLNKPVGRDQEIEVEDKLGALLLAQNTDAFQVWEQVTAKKKTKETEAK